MARLAWLSPLTDDPTSKAAFFSRQVLPHIPRDIDLELFLSEEDLAQCGGAPCCERPVYHALRLPERDAAAPFDAFIFHLEDHAAADFSRFSVGSLPGVAYVYDLHYRALPWGETPEHVSALEGSVEEHIEKFFKPAPPPKDKAVLGYRRDLLAGEEFRGVVVATNPRAVEDLVGRGLPLPIELTNIPAPMPSLKEIAERRGKVRADFALDEKTRVVLFTGRFAAEDRIPLTVEAIARLKLPNVVALFAVTAPAEFSRLSELLNRVCTGLNFDPASLRCVEAYTVQALSDLIYAADCLCLPRFTALRGVSLALPIALGGGVPVITSRFGMTQEPPNNVVAKIDVGRYEGEQLTATLHRILTDRALAATLSTNARSYAETILNPEVMVADLLELIRHRLPLLRDGRERSEQDFTKYRAWHLEELRHRLGSDPLPLSPEFAVPGGELSARVFARAAADFGW